MEKFNWRSFTSLYLVISFIIIIISGIILYIAPPGRIANWSYIPILGLEKDQWQSLHIIFTFLFIIASGFHLYFNWAIFMTYLKNRLSKKITLKIELLFSFVFTLFIFLFVLTNLPPFSTVVEFGESFKDSWENTKAQPPIPHAEELSVDEMAKLLNKPVGILVSDLETHSITVTDTNMVIKDLAEENDKTPDEIYSLLQTQTRKKNSSKKISDKYNFGKKINDHDYGRRTNGRGYGRKTILQLCEEMKIDQADAIKKLASKGINANYSSIIREVALAYKMRPVEIINIITDKK